MKFYHGSITLKGLPTYGVGKSYNDYGVAFYGAEEIELAKEWACPTNDMDGVVNEYELDTSSLKILNLCESPYTILHWIAVLLKFRQFDLTDEIAIAAKAFLLDHYYIDVSQYDIVIGYRADDSYFKYADDFVRNIISLEKLTQAMALGHLGKQVALISQKAFRALTFINYQVVDKNIYYTKRIFRDLQAREEYQTLRASTRSALDDTYIIDIMRKEAKKHD